MAKKIKKELLGHLLLIVISVIVFIVALTLNNQPKPLSEKEIEVVLAKDTVAVTKPEKPKKEKQKKHKQATKANKNSTKTTSERNHLDETIRE